MGTARGLHGSIRMAAAIAIVALTLGACSHGQPRLSPEPTSASNDPAADAGSSPASTHVATNGQWRDQAVTQLQEPSEYGVRGANGVILITTKAR